jgi:hypothetical protein
VGLILLLGDEGSGKTTLMRALREVYAGTGRDTMLYDARAIQDPLPSLQDDLQRRSRDRAPDPPIAFLDAADRISGERLAEVVARAGRESESLVQVILSGRPELWARLQLPDHAEINSRVELSVTLGGLRRHEIGFYLRHRALAAGRSDRRVEQAALERLYAYSGGNPAIVDRIGARLDGVAAETIAVADIDAVIAGLESGRAGGRLTIAQFGATDADAPGRSAHAVGAQKGRVVAATASIVIVATALVAASLWWWKDDFAALTRAIQRPGTLHWTEAQRAAVPATLAPATQAPAGQSSAAREAVGPMPTAAAEPMPTAQVLAASESDGSPRDRSGAADERALVNDSALGSPWQESSHDPATTTDDAAAPPRSYETGAAEVAEQRAAVASPAIPPDRAPGAVDDALAGKRPTKPAASEFVAEVAPAESSAPTALDQASPRDEFAARDIRPQAADAPSPSASIVVSRPVREQSAPPAEASLRASAAPSAHEPDVAQSVSPKPPTLATPAKPQRRPEADALMNKGMQLLDLGDVASARLLFERAADLGVPEACTAIGETFDPAELGRRRIIGMKGQPDIALKWYRLGDERGDPQARERISRLAGLGR